MGPGQGYLREKGKGRKTKSREGCGGGELTIDKLFQGRECWETRLRAGSDLRVETRRTVRRSITHLNQEEGDTIGLERTG